MKRITKKVLWTAALTLAVWGAKAQSAGDLVEQVRARYAPDKRVAVFEIEAEQVNDTLYILKGKCDDPEAVRALRERLRRGGVAFEDYTTLLPSRALGDRTQALVTLSSVNLRTAPAHAAEFATQAILGTPLRVLDVQGGWYRVQTPDGYISWVDDDAIALKTPGEMESWRMSQRFIYTGYIGFVYAGPDEEGSRVSDLVLGTVLEVDPAGKTNRKFIAVRLPDGRSGDVKRSETQDFTEWAARELRPDGLERTARSMMGVPYLWGGTSVKGVDCSGMVKTAYFANGVILARDASQQALTGEKIAPEAWRDCRKGDLLFFGNAQTGRVTHVAMYLGDGKFIHASGRVKVNSIDPQAEDFVGYPCLSISRIVGRIGTPGIARVAGHPWYFNR